MTAKARGNLGTLAAVGLGIAGLVAALHWYDTKRLTEQIDTLAKDVCASLGTEQTIDIVDRVASSHFQASEPVEWDVVSMERLREIMRAYTYAGWRLNGTAYFGTAGRWWRLQSYGNESLTEIDHAPNEIADVPAAKCTVKSGSNRNEVKLIMLRRWGEVETAIVVSARRDH